MDLAAAKALLEPFGCYVLYNETLRLYMVILSGVTVYIHPEDLAKIDEPELKSFVGQSVLRVLSTSPQVMVH